MCMRTSKHCDPSVQANSKINHPMALFSMENTWHCDIILKNKMLFGSIVSVPRIT